MKKLILIFFVFLSSFVLGQTNNYIGGSFDIVPIIEVDSNNVIQIYYCHSKGFEDPLKDDFYIIKNTTVTNYIKEDELIILNYL